MPCKVKCSGKKRSKCSDKNRGHQPFPTSGSLAANMNHGSLPLDKLCKNPAEQDVVYFYVMTSVEYHDQKFWQCGSGPNFQRGLITLCTCKHRMRSSKGACDWKGKWIAGFTSITAHEERRNFLFCLMQVSEAFESQYDLCLWLSRSILNGTSQAKAAHLNMFGDVYEPQNGCTCRFTPEGYKKPCENHNRGEDWPEDIHYGNGYSGRPAALLVGDANKSFLWNEPTIWYSRQLPRGYKKLGFNEFCEQLCSGRT